MKKRFAVIVLAAALLVGPSFAQVSPESAEKYQAGQEQFQKRRYADAIKLFDEAVTLDGKNAQAYQAMGLTYQKMKTLNASLHLALFPFSCGVEIPLRIQLDRRGEIRWPDTTVMIIE